MNDNLLKYNHDLKLKTSIENRTIYSSDYAELNVFETRQVAEKINLKFGFPIIASMLTGKKVMHLDGIKAFDFFPGESVVLPSDKKMLIDFPLASAKNPTRCLALGIDPEKIKETVQIFNENTRIEFENDTHSFDTTAVHLDNNQQVQFVLDRIFNTFLEAGTARDALLFDNNRMAFIVKYMREHLTENIQVDKLANKACMSTSNFYRSFKNTFGESPIDYLNAERIKFAKKLIQQTNKKFADIAYKSGFNNTSYFNRQFKRFEKITPNQYRKLVKNNIA